MSDSTNSVDADRHLYAVADDGLPAIDKTMPVEVLGEIATFAYGAARDRVVESLRFAIRCGQALEMARMKLEGRSWDEWVTSLGISRTTAYRYRRLAKHAPQLSDFEGGIEDACQLLSSPWERLTEQQKQEMVRMVERDGLGPDEVAAALDISPSTVWYWTSKKNRDHRGAHRRRTRSRAKMAEIELQRREAGRLAAKTAGAIPEAYSLLRRAAQKLEAARGSVADREVRTALERALGHVYNAEQETTRALGTYVESEAA